MDFTLDNTYLGATHSDNSIGNSAPGVTSLLYGAYEDSVVGSIADKIRIRRRKGYKKGICFDPPWKWLSRNAYSVSPTAWPIVDQLIPWFAPIEIQRQDSSKLLFISYTAHATCLFSRM